MRATSCVRSPWIAAVLTLVTAGCGAQAAKRWAGSSGEAAATPLAESSAAPGERPGLGTEFGEQVSSHVHGETFVRATPDPFAEVAIFYNDEEGVLAQADRRGGAIAPVSAHTPDGGISVSLTDPSGGALPGIAAPGRAYVVGGAGERYDITITNETGGRYEIVASVDGLDVIDGQSAGYHKRGYLLDPYSTLVIDGFRTSDATVAAFRFGAVADSYAARTGDDRNVGVIGLAMFSEQGSQWTTDEIDRRESADPFPNRYAVPPP